MSISRLSNELLDFVSWITNVRKFAFAYIKQGYIDISDW